MSHVVGIVGSDGSSMKIDWHKIALERGDEIERLRRTLESIAKGLAPGNRNLDQMIRDMTLCCDIARAALAEKRPMIQLEE